MEVRGADIRIDFGAQAFADSDRAEVVMGVVRDNRLAAGDESTDFLGGEALVLGDLDHLRGDSPFARGFNLGHVVVPLKHEFNLFILHAPAARHGASMFRASHKNIRFASASPVSSVWR
jgi:hypothetical protein